MILFIDELHTLVGAGGAEGAIDASNVLKPALSRGEIQCIGATTFDEYRKYIEKDAALERRFQRSSSSRPRGGDGRDPQGAARALREHHRVQITDDALVERGRAVGRYITGPRAARQVDRRDRRSRARVRLKSMTKPPDLADLEERSRCSRSEKDEAVKNADYERAAELRDKAEKLRKEKEQIQQEWREKSPTKSTASSTRRSSPRSSPR